MYRAALLLLTFLFLWGTTPEAAEAQQTTGTVQGRVITETGGPLAGVQASIQGSDLGGITNRSGRFLILNVPAGEHTLQVQSLGYGTAAATITVTPGQVTTQDFQLGQEPIALGEVRVTVGSRASHTAADELPVPVDVYTVGQLQAANAPDFLGTIEEIAPSIYVPQEQISDLTSGLRPFQLRGMSPDQSLVLINGKRRHKTASVAVFGNSAPGSSGVDMNAIPQMAIGQVEVLRDGASAQYGSDAIAGVINLGLKNTPNPLTVEASVGKYFPDDFESDGFRNRIAANFGIEFLGGVLNLTGEYARRNPTERAGADPRPQLICGDQTPPDPSCPEGDADVVDDIDGDGVNEVVQKNNTVPQPNHLVGDGFYENEMIFANYERDVGDDQLFYVYGGASSRFDLHSGFYRRANDDRNWPSIYPTGFLPHFDVDTRDLQVTTGLTGEWGDWNYDGSLQFGQNRLDIDITNTHNASLGPCLSDPCAPGPDGVLGTADDPGIPNAKRFYAGSLQLTEYNASFDIARDFEVGMASPLNLALGTQLRLGNYKIEAGELGSYVDGGHPTQWGRTAAAGSQVFPGFRPDDEADDSRTNIGVFAEGEVNLTETVLANAAARFESYSDFGENVTGKLALRYQPVQDFILRGSISTGFRAPTLANLNWKHVSTGFQTDPATGNQVAFEIGEFPVTSPEAQELGAPDVLQEETSVNYAAGFAWTPFNNFNLTVDGYFVEVSDAIILSGTIQGPLVEQILGDAGFQATAIKYMTNAIDFETKGVDITASYRWLLAQEQFLEFSGSFNLNRVEVTDQVPLPDVLASLDEQYMSAGEVDEFENEKPQEKAIATILYNYGDFQTNLQGHYLTGTTELIDTNPDVLQTFGSEFVLDVEGSYLFDNGLEVGIGVENIFDNYPGQTLDGHNFLGIFPWGTRIIGINGRRLFSTVRYTFD